MRRSALVLVLFLLVSPLDAASVLYVSVSEEQRLARFEVDETSGRITLCDSLRVDGTPGAMAVAPDQRTLYVSLRSTNSLGSFRIDETSGKLTPLNVVPAGGNAAYVTTDRTGRYLLTAYYSDGRVAVHALDENGAIGELLHSIPTAEKAHCIVVDRSNRFTFVPHTGPEKIFQFLFNAETGELNPHDAGPVDTTDADHACGPRHVWLHPTRELAFVSLEQGSAIAACRIDPQGGSLTPIHDTAGRPVRVSTIPDDFNEGNSTADIELTPDGRFAYVSNRGHDSLAGFAVDAENGSLTPLGQFATERTPRSFNIHPSGRFLYAAGQNSGNLAAYHISPEGRLQQFQTLPVGKGPAWVQIVTLAEEN